MMISKCIASSKYSQFYAKGLGATRFDKIKKSKTVTPLQARARVGFAEETTKKRLSLRWRKLLTQYCKGESRITSYDLWKVVEEPKLKKKKFKWRVKYTHM